MPISPLEFQMMQQRTEAARRGKLMPALEQRISLDNATRSRFHGQADACEQESELHQQPNMTNEELIKRFPRASRSFIRQNSDSPGGLRAVEQKPTEGHALERPAQREDKSGHSIVDRPEPRCRTRIRFTIYAVRPCDWDGYHIKELQDLLVKSGILDGDEWNLLQGEVVSEKVHSKDEERTEIEINQPTP